jgi:hypothetical protein
MLRWNHFWAKPAYFDFSSSNLTVQFHILSTAGDAKRGLTIARARNFDLMFTLLVPTFYFAP